MVGPRDPNEIEDEEPDALLEEGADAGSVDDESGDDAQTGQEFEEPEAQERVGRRDDRTREELRALREHNTRVEFELQQLRAEREQRQYAQQQQEETDAQFEARVALIDDPEVRMRVRHDRSEHRHNKQMALFAFATADRADKAAYDTKANADPIRKKYAQDVEQLLAVERRKGHDIDRESAFFYLRGRAMETAKGKTNQARDQGQLNIQRQQARTTGGRGDQQPQNRQRRFAAGDMSPEAVKARLERDDAYI